MAIETEDDSCVLLSATLKVSQRGGVCRITLAIDGGGLLLFEPPGDARHALHSFFLDGVAATLADLLPCRQAKTTDQMEQDQGAEPSPPQ